MLSEEPENVEKFQKRLVKVTPQHNDECKKLLQLMGIPFIEVLIDIVYFKAQASVAGHQICWVSA